MVSTIGIELLTIIFLKLKVVLFMTETDVPEKPPMTTETTLEQLISDGVVTNIVSLAMIPLAIAMLMFVCVTLPMKVFKKFIWGFWIGFAMIPDILLFEELSILRSLLLSLKVSKMILPKG